MTGFLARRLANYVLLCLAATFLAFALGSLTFSPLGQLPGRNPPPPKGLTRRRALFKHGLRTALIPMATLFGDPQRDRLIAADVDGIWLDPSGPVRSAEPRGRRTDSPARPDAVQTTATPGWRRQLRADAGLLTPAPVVGLLWTFLDDGGLLTWTCATALTTTLALWWAALRGSDPT